MIFLTWEIAWGGNTITPLHQTAQGNQGHRAGRFLPRAEEEGAVLVIE